MGVTVNGVFTFDCCNLMRFYEVISGKSRLDGGAHRSQLTMGFARIFPWRLKGQRVRWRRRTAKNRSRTTTGITCFGTFFTSSCGWPEAAPPTGIGNEDCPLLRIERAKQSAKKMGPIKNVKSRVAHASSQPNKCSSSLLGC